MVGDVNLFLNDPDDAHAAEVEVMIAEDGARGKGMGREALLQLLRYGPSCNRKAQSRTNAMPLHA